MGREKEKKEAYTGESRMLLFMGRCHRKEKPGGLNFPSLYLFSLQTLGRIYFSYCLIYIERGCVCVCVYARLYFVFDELLSILAGLMRATCSKQISARAHREHSSVRPHPPRPTIYHCGMFGARVCPDKVVCVDSLHYLSSVVYIKGKNFYFFLFFFVVCCCASESGWASDNRNVQTDM